MTAPPPVDLTSSLFLGRTHPSRSLPGWSALTTGRPAVLGEPPAADELARYVAATQGAAAGIVARSTLHALVDLMQVLLHPGDVLVLDERVYPLTRWAAGLAADRGVHMISYPHHRPGPVAAGRGRVWWATDGWCPGCNRPAPLRRLAALASATGGGVVVDDTLAFGVLGRRGEARFRRRHRDAAVVRRHARRPGVARVAGEGARRAADRRHRACGRRHGAAPARRQPGARQLADVRGPGGRPAVGARRGRERGPPRRARQPRPPAAATAAGGRGDAGRSALPARGGGRAGRRRRAGPPRGGRAPASARCRSSPAAVDRRRWASCCARTCVPPRSTGPPTCCPR